MSKAKSVAIAATVLTAVTATVLLYASSSAPQAGFIDKSGNLQLTLPGLQDGGEFHDGLAPVKVGENWGYINKSGKWVIPPQFSSAQNFSEGLAAVLLRSKKYAYVNARAQGMLEINATQVGDFHNGLAQIVSGDKCGYINHSGDFVIPPQYKFGGIRNSSLGAIPVELYHKPDGKKTSWQYVNHENRPVLQSLFLNAKEVREGLAPVLVQVDKPNSGSDEAKWGYLDHSGKSFAIAAQYPDAEPFSEGLAAVAISGIAPENNATFLYSYVDCNNKALEVKLAYAAPFSEGLAAAAERSKARNNRGYINKSGKFVIPPRFAQANNFSEGLAFTKREGLRPFWQAY